MSTFPAMTKTQFIEQFVIQFVAANPHSLASSVLDRAHHFADALEADGCFQPRQAVAAKEEPAKTPRYDHDLKSIIREYVTDKGVIKARLAEHIAKTIGKGLTTAQRLIFRELQEGTIYEDADNHLIFLTKPAE